jgi:hypothetical protein
MLLLAWLICALTPFVAAQDGGSGDQSSGQSATTPQSRLQMDPAALTQILTKRLNLTSVGAAITTAQHNWCHARELHDYS